MAIKERFAVKTVLGNENLELRADPGESFLIKDIQIFNPANDYITLLTQKTTAGFFRVGGVLGSHLPFMPGRSRPVIDPISHIAFTAKLSGTAVAITDDMPIIEGDGTEHTDIAIGRVSGTSDVAINTDEKIPAAGANVPVPSQKTLLAWMIEQGMMTGYPVATGETFRITGAAQADAIQMVLYEIYEEADMKPEAANGSRGMEYTYVNYGNTGAPINGTDSFLYTNTLDPGELIAFPFGKTVPAKTEINLMAILISDFAPADNTGSDNIRTMFLKMIKDRVVLHDEDRNGLLMMAPSGANVGGRDRIGEGQSLMGNYSDVDLNMPLLFAEPMKFLAGDDLDIYLTTATTGGGQSINVASQEIGLILKAKRAE